MLVQNRPKSSVVAGYTVLEIGIVLVAIGLLLGGVLKGSELINSAKTRQITNQTTSFQASWLAFKDRFKALPGDFILAENYLDPNPSTPTIKNGNGDGEVEVMESPLAMVHLRAASMLQCAQCTATDTATPSWENSPVNVYGGVISVWHDKNNHAVDTEFRTRKKILQFHTGPRIPSNILADIDRKLDDGTANRGIFLFNSYDPVDSGSDAPITKNCISSTAPTAEDGALDTDIAQLWHVQPSNPPQILIELNCGASLLL